MDIRIENISFKEVLQLKKAFVEAGLKLRSSRKTVWLGAKYNGQIVGVCADRRTKYGVKFKSDLVLKPYRMQGIYRGLFNERLKRVQHLKPLKINAYCTKNRLPTYFKHGFVARGRIKRITYVERRAPFGQISVTVNKSVPQEKNEITNEIGE